MKRNESRGRKGKLHPVYAAVAGSFVFQPMLAVAQGAPAASAQLPEVTVKADVGRELGEGYNPPNAVSATKTEAPLRDIPQTVNVVTAEVMRDQRATSMQDVLKNVPGVAFSTGDGQRDQVSIR